MDSVREIINNAVSFLQQLRFDLPVVFWGAIIVVVLLILVPVILSKIRKAKRRVEAEIAEEEHKVFVPLEKPDEEISAEFLTLQEKLLRAKGSLDKKLTEQLRNKGPQALGDIGAVYSRTSPEIQLSLKKLVLDERMMERYCRRLGKPGYTQGVLVDCWKYFGNQNTLKEFMEMLASNDENVQMTGASLLSSIKDPQSLPMLAAALMWPDHFMPARVAEVFTAFGESGAKLLAFMLPKVNDKHKGRVLDTIAGINKPYPPDNVIECLTADSPQIRASAAMALGAGRMTQSVGPLMLISADRDWHVRAAVAKALGMIGDQRAVSVLEVLAQDADGWVSQAAKSSLELFAAV